MPMTVSELESEVLKLPEHERAELLGRLIQNLANATKLDTSVEQAWIDEAIRRDEEMDAGSVDGIPANEVFEDLNRKEK